MISYSVATTDEDYATARNLFVEYADLIYVNLCFQKFDDELNSLSKMYARPLGGILLVKENEHFIGCAGVRKINENIGELKRMYINPAYQKKGIGKHLLNQALELAIECNYKKIRLDTLNNMFAAIHLYKKAGFYEIAPYYSNPIEATVYLERSLI